MLAATTMVDKVQFFVEGNVGADYTEEKNDGPYVNEETSQLQKPLQYTHFLTIY
jgi:hypothetical protein